MEGAAAAVDISPVGKVEDGDDPESQPEKNRRGDDRAGSVGAIQHDRQLFGNMGMPQPFHQEIFVFIDKIGPGLERFIRDRGGRFFFSVQDGLLQTQLPRVRDLDSL
jgi:hypothetical protein